jgi:hypothetical protein
MVRINTMTEAEMQAFITDELAQKEGYPSAEVYWLEAELIKLAAKWWRKKDKAVVKAYHDLYAKLIDMGWSVDLLSKEGFLPPEHMPQES